LKLGRSRSMTLPLRWALIAQRYAPACRVVPAPLHERPHMVDVT